MEEVKFTKSSIYWDLLDDYLKGNGIPWSNYGFQRKDVLDMIAFYGNHLNQKTFIGVVQYLVSDLLYIE